MTTGHQGGKLGVRRNISSSPGPDPVPGGETPTTDVNLDSGKLVSSPETHIAEDEDSFNAQHVDAEPSAREYTYQVAHIFQHTL